MNRQPIGIFDSGVGGLTVLKQMIVRMPYERMIYLGDTARLPYGTKSRETVIRYSLKNASFLIDKGVKMLVVACNTASSLALEVLKETFSIPIVGVILPGARKAALCSQSHKVGVIGTMATIRSRAYEFAIRRFAKNADILSIPCPLFVSLAEEGWIEDDVTRLVAERYLTPFKKKGVDVLVLGCTHYPLLKPVLSSVMGKDVVLVDSAQEVAVQVEETLEFEAMAVREPDREWSDPPAIYLSDVSPHFLELSKIILGTTSLHVEYVDVG